MKQISKKGCRGKDVSRRDSVFVGLDVHKRSIYMAVRINGKEVGTKSLTADWEAVVKVLAPYRAGLKKVVYEAGPTGFGLARRLREEGYPLDVIAPHKTPRVSQFETKSDRLDCSKLAEYAEKELLKAVAIPTLQEEADRQVVRLRNAMVEQKRKAKQRIKSFFLQYGLKTPRGLDYWTHEAIGILREMELPPALRFTLDRLLEDLFYFDRQLKDVNIRLRVMMKEKAYEKKAKILRTHPGVGEVTTLQVLTEIYQPERFENAKQVAAYVGLAPRIRQSGETRKEGHLQKAGKGTLRATLVEAAWSWIQKDTQAYRVFRRLVRNTGHVNKAIVAMAHKLLIHLWTMLVRKEVYRPMR